MFLLPEEEHKLEIVALTEQAIDNGVDDAGFNAVVHLGRGNRIECNKRVREQAYASARKMFETHRRQAMVYCWTTSRWAHMTNIAHGTDSIRYRDRILALSDGSVEMFNMAHALRTSPIYDSCRVFFLGFDDLNSVWTSYSLADKKRVHVALQKCLGEYPSDPVAIWRDLLNRVKLRRTK